MSASLLPTFEGLIRNTLNDFREHGEAMKSMALFLLKEPTQGFHLLLLDDVPEDESERAETMKQLIRKFSPKAVMVYTKTDDALHFRYEDSEQALHRRVPVHRTLARPYLGALETVEGVAHLYLRDSSAWLQ